MAPLKWVLAVILIIAVSNVKYASGVPNTTALNVQCGPPSDSEVYDGAAMKVRRKLVQNTGRRGGNYYTSKRVMLEGEWKRCYGHATCNLALDRQDCINCLVATSGTVVHQPLPVCSFRQ